LASGNSPSKATRGGLGTIDSADAARQHAARDGTGDVRLPPLHRTDTGCKLDAGHTAVGAMGMVTQANNIGNLPAGVCNGLPVAACDTLLRLQGSTSMLPATLKSASSCHVRVTEFLISTFTDMPMSD